MDRIYRSQRGSVTLIEMGVIMLLVGVAFIVGYHAIEPATHQWQKRSACAVNQSDYLSEDADCIELYQESPCPDCGRESEEED